MAILFDQFGYEVQPDRRITGFVPTLPKTPRAKVDGGECCAIGWRASPSEHDDLEYCQHQPESPQDDES